MGGATKVAAGILLSRLSGFVRDASLAYYFGAGPHADVFRTVLRGPNILQNLLGEQTLSASFIPVYSRLSDEDPERAGRLAGAVFTLLLVVVTALVILGILLAEPLVTLLAPGFLIVEPGSTDRFALAVRAVRWIFPMTGVLVLSAWALGVLNSHRRFFVSYVAPVAWNAAIVASLVVGARWLAVEPATGGGAALDRLLLTACAGALAGAVLQLLVQLPAVVAVLRGFRATLSLRVRGLGEVGRAFLPLVAARGVVQISAYLDLLLASFLAVGAIGALGWAYTLYILPVSLFAMSVAAAELPELARRNAVAGEFGGRVEAALHRVAVLVVPTAVGYLALGYPLVGAIYRRGSFGSADTALVHAILAAYSLGLAATTASRVLANAFYALGETAVPARIAALRVTVSAAAGAVAMVWLDRWPVSVLPWQEGQTDLRMGAVGLALGSALGAWIEVWRLRRGLVALRGEERGRVRLAGGRAAWLVTVSVLALLPAIGLWWMVRETPRPVQGALVIGCYAAVYLGTLARLGEVDPRRLLADSLGPVAKPADDDGEDKT